MSKNKLASGLMAVLVGFLAGSAGAQTLSDLSQKNRELLILKADIELAKKRNELKSEQLGKPAKDAAGAGQQGSPLGIGANDSAGGNRGTLPVPPAPRKVVMQPQSDPSALSLKAVYGDENNPLVEFTYNGEDRPALRQGDMVLPSWRLRAVNGRVAVIEHLGKGGKAIGTKTLMLPSTSTPAPVSRYDVVRGAPAVTIPRLPDLGARR
jgi:hypothetical protein